MGPAPEDVPPDRAWSLPPLDEVFARQMLQSLRCWPALCSLLDRPAERVQRLIETLMRLSCLVVDHPEIEELELNPLSVTATAVVVLCARVQLDPNAEKPPLRPYDHLAIAPYPEKYATDFQMEDGTPLVLRPIKPEDEPLWHDLLASCSTQTIWFRFSHLFKHTTHEMASRYCFIDYDRELGIVAEVVEPGGRKLLGVGRLAADADHHTAEFALLVADRWQGRGLGGVLADHCLTIAKDWGIRRVVGELSPDNLRMLAVFRSRGFEINSHPDRDVTPGAQGDRLTGKSPSRPALGRRGAILPHDGDEVGLGYRRALRAAQPHGHNRRGLFFLRVGGLPAARPEHQHVGQHQRAHQTAAHADGQHASQAPEALVAGDHQRGEADHGGQRIENDGRGRGGAHAVIAAGAAAEVVDDVDAVLRPQPDDQGQHDHVGRIEGDVQETHESEHLQHPQPQRQHGQQDVADAAEIEPQHQHDRRQGVDGGLLVTSLHVPRGFVDLERIARHFLVHRADLVDEGFAGGECPRCRSWRSSSAGICRCGR